MKAGGQEGRVRNIIRSITLRGNASEGSFGNNVGDSAAPDPDGILKTIIMKMVSYRAYHDTECMKYLNGPSYSESGKWRGLRQY